LDAVVRRATQAGGDELAFKLLRNLAAAGGAPLAVKLAIHVPHLVGMLQDPIVTPDLRVEVLGTLAAVLDLVPMTLEQNQEQVDVSAQPPQQQAASSWNTLLVGCDVFGVLQSCLTALTEDDALLEAVVLTGALAGHTQLVAQLAESGAVSQHDRGRGEGLVWLGKTTELCFFISAFSHFGLHTPLQLQAVADLMGQRCQDDEFVLQVCIGATRATAAYTCDCCIQQVQALIPIYKSVKINTVCVGVCQSLIFAANTSRAACGDTGVWILGQVECDGCLCARGLS